MGFQILVLFHSNRLVATSVCSFAQHLHLLKEKTEGLYQSRILLESPLFSGIEVATPILKVDLELKVTPSKIYQWNWSDIPAPQRVHKHAKFLQIVLHSVIPYAYFLLCIFSRAYLAKTWGCMIKYSDMLILRNLISHILTSA